MTEDNRAAIYEENGLWVARASALGMCVRSLWAYMQGMTPMETPEWMQEKYDEGTSAEPFIMAELADRHSSTIIREQEEVEVKVGDTWLIRGHIDGVLAELAGLEAFDGPVPAVGEAKFFAASTYDRWLRTWDGNDLTQWAAAFPYYAAQISTYMTALDMPAIFAIGLKEPQEDGSVKLGDVEFYTLSQPPIPMKDLKLKLIRLGKMTEMPQCDTDQFPCPFYFLHDEKDIVESTDRDLGEQAKQYYNGNVLEKRGKEMKDKAKSVIAAALDVHGLKGQTVKAHDHDDREWQITDVLTQGRAHFDVKAAEAAGVDTKPYMKRSADSRYPKIKPPADYEDGSNSGE